MILVLSQNGESAVNPFSVAAWDTNRDGDALSLVARTSGGDSITLFSSNNPLEVASARTFLLGELEDVTANWDKSKRTIDLCAWARARQKKRDVREFVAQVPADRLEELAREAKARGARIQLPCPLKGLTLRGLALMVEEEGMPHCARGNTRVWLGELLAAHGVEVAS